MTGTEGNHGEDVKEEYFYLDSTPTHSYMKALYKKRFDWFLANRADLARQISWTEAECCPGHRRWLLAIPSKDRLIRVLRYLLDEAEFLSPYGIRSLSKFHQANPYVFQAGGEEFRVAYTPGEGNSYLFGGNSNWRGPVWFPVNYLVIEALERYHHYYGDALKVECPTGSGNLCTLQEVATELSRRLSAIFLPDGGGGGPATAATRATRTAHWIVTCCSFMNISMARPAEVSVPAIKPAGPPW